MWAFALLYVFVFIETSVSLQDLEDLPDPRIIIVGATGAGKSSLANAFLGCDPMSNDCLFDVCSSVDSCTKHTTFGTGMWLGSGQNFTVVDSPGFGDSDQEDDLLIQEMMSVLKNSVGYTHSILLLLNGQQTRFTESLQSMLKQMSSIFGEQWWDFLTVGVSFWSYDPTEIEKRNITCTYYPQSCKDEAWFQREMNSQFQEKFHVTKNFSYVFTDAWSQTFPHKLDQVEQDHWQEETQAFWDIITSEENEFEFKTIDDILQENRDMKQQIKWLNDVITNNISDLAAAVTQNDVAIVQNSNAVERNGGDINSLNSQITDVQMDMEKMNLAVTQNDVAIVQNSNAIERNGDDISTLANRVAMNEDGVNFLETNVIPNLELELSMVNSQLNSLNSKITDVQMDMEKMNMAPIGSVTGWLGGNTIQLPYGWQLCDASKIIHGPMAGQRTPNLNSEGLFLRGGPPGQAWGIQTDMIKQHEHTVVDEGHKHTDSGHTHTFWDEYNEPEISDNADDRWVGSDQTIIKTKTTSTGYAQISHEKTNVFVGSVSGAEAGWETRPKNIAVEWIIKVV